MMRILLPISASLECILLGVLLAGGFPWLIHPALVLSLLILVFSLRSSGLSPGFEPEKQKTRVFAESSAKFSAEARETDAEDAGLHSQLREQLRAALKKTQQLEARLEGDAGCLREFRLQHHRMLCALDAQKKLAGVINEKTETATLEMTNHIYSIAGWSKKVEDLIRNVMGQLSSGDFGLHRQALDLEEELRRIEKLIGIFKLIENDYIVELERISGTMRSVDTFTDTITDLAERTNVLAINASIEAARAGQAGKGFAVIASEIQGLAGNTMKIAEEISSTMETSVHTVRDSIGKYGERIETAVSRLEQSGEAHARIIEQLRPQIEKVSSIVEDSGRLSSEVTQNINEVTVHLQYQDNVRQVLEHLLQLLVELSRKGEQVASVAGLLDHTDAKAVEEEVRKMVTGMCTTREEWKAFGYELEEEIGRNGVNEQEKEVFEGDVTLF
jgi:methyl-accepting chemotaxis protein